MAEYDVIIVGGGTTGCVLASRLSEHPSRTVLLLEAGPYFKDRSEFPDELLLLSSRVAAMPEHAYNWGFVGELIPGRNHALPRGKVIGGSSAVNGAAFVRARKDDFDEWESLGNDQWAYESILPYFIKCETDLDFSGPGHGSEGPMAVRRPLREEMPQLPLTFMDACLDNGFPEELDKNSESGGGIGWTPRTYAGGVRLNTAMAYLSGCQGRENLAVYGDTLVRRAIVESGRAVGVEVEQAGHVSVIRGGEIILTAGSIKSPQLLLLSGIGPADQLRAHDIRVVNDSPSVGQTIQDHPSVAVRYAVSEDSPTPTGSNSVASVLNYTAPDSAILEDLQITFSTDMLVRCTLEKELSRGQLTLASPDPRVNPKIKLNYLSEASDLTRMRLNVRTAVELLASAQFRSLGVSRVSPANDDLASDRALDGWIRHNLGTAFHTSCGACMGKASEPAAVVDQWGIVHGVEGLRVLDVSIMPSIVRRGPYPTAVMIGERSAAFFK